MVLVAILEPSIEKSENSLSVRQGVHANVVTLEGLHACLGEAVAFGAPDRREAQGEIELADELPDLLGGMGRTVIGQPLAAIP